MKKILLVAFGLLVVGHAHAGTAQDKYNSLVNKYAAPADERTVGKTACVCLTALADTVGWIVISGTQPGTGIANAECFIPFFASDGSISGGGFCQSFTVLAR
jgi:hypothetical protein